MTPFSIVAWVIAWGLAAASAHAAVSTTQTRTIAAQPVNFAGSFGFNAFDPALGTLTAVTLTFQAGVSGSIGVENLGATPFLVNADLSAAVALQRPDRTVLAQATPYAGVSFNAGAFDGTIDDGGISGHSFTGLTATAFALPDPRVDISAADLALFSGAGPIALPVVATDNSGANGGTGVSASLSTSASAIATLRYTYTPVVAAPEPMSFGWIGAGALIVTLSRSGWRPRGRC